MNGATGFYGKLPCLGDFVTRRLPRELIAPWDQWLQESLTSSRTQLGNDWLDRYLTSPLWRFVLSPGVAGQVGWTGVLMPSVDRVGRYFPLTLSCPLPAGTNPATVLEVSDWFEQALQAASQAHYGAPCATIGQGGTIPLMNMLSRGFPQAQMMVCGVLGPRSNAHGPNEFLHLPYAQRLTAAVAEVIARMP